MQASVLFTALNVFYADESEEPDKKFTKGDIRSKGQKGSKTGKLYGKYENYL